MRSGMCRDTGGHRPFAGPRVARRERRALSSVSSAQGNLRPSGPARVGCGGTHRQRQDDAYAATRSLLRSVGRRGTPGGRGSADGPPRGGARARRPGPPRRAPLQRQCAREPHPLRRRRAGHHGSGQLAAGSAARAGHPAGARRRRTLRRAGPGAGLCTHLAGRPRRGDPDEASSRLDPCGAGPAARRPYRHHRGASAGHHRLRRRHPCPRGRAGARARAAACALAADPRSRCAELLRVAAEGVSP